MRVFKILKFIIAVILFCLVAGFVVQHLWNWLMPTLFGLRMITFMQSIGLLVLSKLLLGGIHKHGGGYGGQREWKRHMKQRLENMSPEEREKFRAGMRGRRGWRGFDPCGFDSRSGDPRGETTEPTAQ